jgi:hypothetical protein
MVSLLLRPQVGCAEYYSRVGLPLLSCKQVLLFCPGLCTCCLGATVLDCSAALLHSRHCLHDLDCSQQLLVCWGRTLLGKVVLPVHVVLVQHCVLVLFGCWTVAALQS